ncbi:hypothetical protein FQN50_001637 [Emmonsiellopsis sp. PD_5]|nr:hypothetical protein FQN50_001637 [Emmonsiellopsis sp. PD_5]
MGNFRKRIKDRFSRSRSPLPNTSSSANSPPSAVPTSGQTSSTAVNSSAGSTPVPPAGQNPNSSHSSAPNLGQPSSRVSSPTPPSRDLWERARGKLLENDRKIINMHSGATPDDIHREAEARRKLCEGKRWAFKYKGQSVQVRDTVDSFIRWVDKFKTVVDVAVNAQPMFAGLPWAGIKFLVQVAVSEQQQMGCLLLGLNKISYLIARCRVYEELYLSINHNAAVQNFEYALVDLYTLILRFLAKALQIYARNTIVRGANAIKLADDDIIDFEKQCNGLEERVDREAQICEGTQSKDFREKFSRLVDELKVLKDLRDPLDRIDNRVANIWKVLDDVERGKILNWVSGTPYLDHHRVARTGRTKDTGEWLFKHGNYHHWETSDESMILWLHGIPGAGKTKLISRAIDEFETRPDSVGLAYFYCNRNEASRQQPENVIRSFVKQLSTSRNGDSIPDTLEKIYQKKQATGFASAHLSFEECEDLLLGLVQGHSRTILILDALDECEENTRKALIKWFNRIISQARRLKILISSRRDGDIRHQLGKEANIGIEATDNENDISKFVSERIAKGQDDRQYPISDCLQEEIVQTLLEKSQGMFQWAALQMAEILELELGSEIRERLGRLPGSLKDAYDEIYTKIRMSKGKKPEIAIRAFQWVMCAARPMTADVLVAAVCQDPDDDKTSPLNDIRIDYVLDACRNLIVVDTRSGVCRLSHLSVREYFEDHHWNPSRSNGTVAKVCLSLLNDPDNWSLWCKDAGENEDEDDESWDGDEESEKGVGSSDVADADSEPSPLVLYAIGFWPTHVRNHGDTGIDPRVTELLEKFFGSMHESGPAYRSWYGWYYKRSTAMKRIAADDLLQGFYSELRPSSSPLLAISLFGLYRVLSKWWSAEAINPNQQNKKGMSVLSLAALGNSEDVINKLLELGADVNMQLKYRECGSALVVAARYSNKDTIQLLLKAEADVNLQLIYGWYGSALVAAVVSENKETIQLLLDAEADVNLTLSYGNFSSALAAAVSQISTDKDIIQLLLNAGADVNMQLSCGYYGSALAVAARCSNKNAVQLLLDAGANVNMQLSYSDYGSALAAAVSSRFSDKDTIQLLLNAGADVNMQLSCGYYGSALAVAARYSDKDTIQLLLNAEADVNLQLSYGKYGSALAAAAANIWRNNGDIIQLLLDAGAKVNMPLSHGQYGTALEASRAHGLFNEDIIPLLEEYASRERESEKSSILIPTLFLHADLDANHESIGIQ